MTQENHDNAENFLKKKYSTVKEDSQFGFNEVVSILAEYTEHLKKLQDKKDDDRLRNYYSKG